jgi:haloalkane dehalogenase
MTRTLTKKRKTVLGRSMAYVEIGSGEPLVFLHGNPTSSFLWRNVLPHLTSQARCIAPDLIGMGDSDPLPVASSGFSELARYMEAFLDDVSSDMPLTLVLHDWGGALGFDWACRHPDSVKAIAYMETIVRPFAFEELPESVQPVFAALRSAAGEHLVLDKNVFVERVLPEAIVRDLEPGEHDEYRRPFLERERRWPTLVLPRQLPIDGEPAGIVAVVERYGSWLAETPTPKLLIRAEPGVLITGKSLDLCRTWPNQQEVTVAGLHYVQEDAPDDIGRALAAWYREL